MSLDDDLLRDALAARGSGASSPDLVAVARSVASTERRYGSNALARQAGRRVFAVAGATAAITVAVALGVAVALRPGYQPADSVVRAPGGYLVSTGDDLRHVLRQPAGTAFVADGRIDAVSDDVCPAGGDAVGARLVLDGVTSCIRGAWVKASGQSLDGRFAATVEADGSPRYLGPIDEPTGGGSWTVAALEPLLEPDPNVDAHRLRGLQVVEAWLVGTPPLGCGPVSPYPEDPNGCGPMAFLTDERDEPASIGSGGTVRPPDVALRVQDGAYEAFAPAPQISDGATEPRRATWLVRPSTDHCLLRAHEPCEPAWRLVARLEPLPPDPSFQPSPPRPSAEPPSLAVPVSPWPALTWTTGDRSPFEFPGNTYVNDAVGWEGGFVAVGYTIGVQDRRVTGRIWRSPDGLAWTLLPGDQPDREFDQLVVDGNRLAIVGLHRLPDASQGSGPGSIGIWTSFDGDEWSEPALPGELFEGQHVRSLAAGPAGWLIHANDLDGRERWLLGRPGEAWGLVPVGKDVFARASVSDLVGGTDGWLAFGMTGVDAESGGGLLGGGDPSDDRGAIWWSADGEHWELATIERPGTSIGSVVRAASGWIAVGTDHGGCPRCVGHPQLLWRSDDGRTWTPLDLPIGGLNHRGGLVFAGDDGRAMAIDTLGDGRVRVRETTDGTDWRDVAVFVRPPVGPLDPLVFGPPTIGPNGIVAFDHVSLPDGPEHLYPVPWAAFPGAPPAGAATQAPRGEPGSHDIPCEPAGQECG